MRPSAAIALLVAALAAWGIAARADEEGPPPDPATGFPQEDPPDADDELQEARRDDADRRALLGLGRLELEEQFSTPPVRLRLAGIEEAWQVNPLMIAGTHPPGDDAAWDALEALGVKTVVSIDHAPPDAYAASLRGIQAVHSPMAHGRWRPGQATTAMRAMTFLEGPYFIHAAPGERRALAVGALAAAWNERLGPARIAFLLRRMEFEREGWEGLFQDAEGDFFGWMDTAHVRATPLQFPPAVPLPELVEWMRHFDEQAQLAGAARPHGWAPPDDWRGPHPAFEAESLADSMARWRALDPDADDDLRARMAAAEAKARELAASLRRDDRPAAESAWRGLMNACMDCHTARRD